MSSECVEYQCTSCFYRRSYLKLFPLVQCPSCGYGEMKPEIPVVPVAKVITVQVPKSQGSVTEARQTHALSDSRFDSSPCDTPTYHYTEEDFND